MVSQALWEQVEALPFKDQLDLADRITARIPPDNELNRMSVEEFRAMLDASEQEIIDHPELAITPDEFIASLRDRLHL
jgi:hypothetical protein